MMKPGRREYMREYQRKWIRKRRDRFFADKFCAWCRSTENLVLDHIDPKTKLYPPAQLWGMSDNNPNKIAELKKCQVLCSPCHDDKTYGVGGDNHKYFLSTTETMVCKEGHDLNKVGTNRNVKKNGFVAKKCAYCAHLTNARLRNGKAKTLTEWVEWRKTKDKRV